MTQLRGDTIITAATGAASADVGGEAMIVHFDDGQIYSLNAVGSVIWKLVQTPTRFDALSKCVLDQFDVERERCEADLVDLLQDLEARGLVLLAHDQNA